MCILFIESRPPCLAVLMDILSRVDSFGVHQSSGRFVRQVNLPFCFRGCLGYNLKSIFFIHTGQKIKTTIVCRYFLTKKYVPYQPLWASKMKVIIKS